MNERELLERLGRSTPHRAPEVDALLERAFERDDASRPSANMPLATAATLALAVGASAPAWLEAVPAERERGETLVRAVAHASRVIANRIQAGAIDEPTHD